MLLLIFIALVVICICLIYLAINQPKKEDDGSTKISSWLVFFILSGTVISAMSSPDPIVALTSDGSIAVYLLVIISVGFALRRSRIRNKKCK